MYVCVCVGGAGVQWGWGVRSGGQQLCGVLDAFIREESRAGRVHADVGLPDPALQEATPIPRQVNKFSLLFKRITVSVVVIYYIRSSNLYSFSGGLFLTNPSRCSPLPVTTYHGPCVPPRVAHQACQGVLGSLAYPVSWLLGCSLQGRE